MVKRGSLLTVLGVAAVLSGPAPVRVEAQPGTEPPGFHGMLVVGNETIYVSHLPMFVPKHRYQGIWEVSFGEAADRKYRAERARPGNSGQIFTLAPKESFRLPELTTGRDSFKADIFVGHFERDGNRLLLEDVTVRLRQQAHWHPFLAGDSRPQPLTYALFGKGDEMFLAHWIGVAPSYDQVLSVKPAAPVGEIPPGAQLALLPRKDDQALRAGESVSGLMIVPRGTDKPALVQPVDLKVTAEIYREDGELAEDELPHESHH